MPTIARVLLLSGLACFVFNEEASAQKFYCNLLSDCRNDGRIMSTGGYSKEQCRKVKNKFGKAIAQSRGDGTTCESVHW